MNGGLCGIPGYCFDIDGVSWHNDGTWCDACGFGLGKSQLGEPTAKPRSAEETIRMRKARKALYGSETITPSPETKD